MSFEGYYQILCKNGHYDMLDCYNSLSPNDEDLCCHYCKEKIVWCNLVNTTNGSYCEECKDGSCGYCDNGRIDGFINLEVIKSVKMQKCNLGHMHVIEPAVYKIPNKEK